MKHAAFALILFASIILSVTIIFSIGHKSNRDNEMQNALDVAMENAMDNLKKDKVYTVNDTDEFIADFLEDFAVQMDSVSSFDISIKEADIEKGLFSVEVVMYYKYNTGGQGQVSSDKTIFLERSN